MSSSFDTGSAFPSSGTDLQAKYNYLSSLLSSTKWAYKDKMTGAGKARAAEARHPRRCEIKVDVGAKGFGVGSRGIWLRAEFLRGPFAGLGGGCACPLRFHFQSGFHAWGYGAEGPADRTAAFQISARLRPADFAEYRA